MRKHHFADLGSLDASARGIRSATSVERDSAKLSFFPNRLWALVVLPVEAYPERRRFDFTEQDVIDRISCEVSWPERRS